MPRYGASPIATYRSVQTLCLAQQTYDPHMADLFLYRKVPIA